jgi:hypothetical protein
MRSDPVDVATAIEIGRGTERKMRQNLAWAVGYNSLAIPIAAGVFEPVGVTLRPEIGAISMSGSSVIVALNALSLRRLPLRVRQERARPLTPRTTDSSSIRNPQLAFLFGREVMPPIDWQLREDDFNGPVAASAL